jgi:hypothetical protein
MRKAFDPVDGTVEGAASALEKMTARQQAPGASKATKPRAKPSRDPKPPGPERLTPEWFTAECLLVAKNLFSKALISVGEDKVMLRAHNGARTLFLRAEFPLIPNVKTAAWLKIKANSLETGFPGQASPQATIASIPWQHTFDLDHAAAAIAKHKLGGDPRHIPASAFGVECAKLLAFDLKDAAGVLRKKPQLWGICERGVLGAALARDDIYYEFFLRGKPELIGI